MSPIIEPSEKEFQTLVLELATLNGWRHYHTFDSRRSDPGFPDLVLVRPPRALFVELKSSRGRVSPEQAEWLGELRGCGLDVHVWYPDDFAEIERTLARKVVRGA